MKTVKIAFILLLYLASCSCEPNSRTDDSWKEEVTRDVEQMAIQFFKDSDNKNTEAVVNYLDNSPGFTWVFPPEASLVSREDLVASLKAEMNSENRVVSEWGQMNVVPLSPELAFYQGSFHQDITNSNGELNSFFGIESAVIVLREDGWKFHSGQTYYASVPSEE